MIVFKISIITFSCVFAGIGIYAVIRNMTIECIGELKYMKREAEKRKEIVETSYKEKDAAYLTQIHLEEHIRMINEENACIHELEEKINNHWGWKILNPNKRYVSRFDFL